MSANNICFHGEIRKILSGYPIIWSYVYRHVHKKILSRLFLCSTGYGGDAITGKIQDC